MKHWPLPFIFGSLMALHGHAMNDINPRFIELFSNHCHGLDARCAHAINSLSDIAHAWHETTPAQPSGPFYPRPLPRERDTDLTIRNRGPEALGLKVQIQGQVMDQDGQVIPGAIVEIWQACAAGSYEHPDDPRRPEAPLDPNFQYYGVDRTSEGQYAFKTVVPGAYPASQNWVRPPHIHFQVSAQGFKTLVTQLYFNGNSFTGHVSNLNGEQLNGSQINALNAADLLLRPLSIEERNRLIVSFNEQDGIMLGVFNIYLKHQ